MKLGALSLARAALLAFALPSAGCVLVSHDGASGPASGTVSVAWTVEGSTSPAACDAHFADSLAIDIYDPGGSRVTTTHVACDAFVAYVDLDPGDYSLDLTLVDDHDHAVSTTLTLDTTVYGDAETDLDIDFPSNSFF